MVDNAIDMLKKGMHCIAAACPTDLANAKPREEELLPIHMFLASLYMNKARNVPRSGPGVPANTPTRESLFQLAIEESNKAMRLNQTSILVLLNTGCP
jgi:hypothetical protein